MRRLLTAAILCALPAVAVCERLSLTVPNSSGFLGVDEQGMISEEEELEGVGEVKVSFNTKSLKVKEIGTGQCTNLSGETQTYKNPPEFDSGDLLEKSKLVYKVKKSGAAKLKLSGTVNAESADELEAQLRAAGAT